MRRSIPSALHRELRVQHNYEVIYETIEDGWIMATVPDLPGAVTQGETLEEARENIREVVQLLLESYREEFRRHHSSPIARELLSLETTSL